MRTNQFVSGVALDRDFMRYATQYEVERNGRVWNSVNAPCANCNRLIDQARASWPLFTADREKVNAPLAS